MNRISQRGVQGNQMFPEGVSDDSRARGGLKQLEIRDIFDRWIAQGAQWNAHWAYQPPEWPRVPEDRQKITPSAGPIDRFVHARLEERRLAPAVEAGRPAHTDSPS
jgi:hypothetical protein